MTRSRMRLSAMAAGVGATLVALSAAGGGHAATSRTAAAAAPVAAPLCAYPVSTTASGTTVTATFQIIDNGSCEPDGLPARISLVAIGHTGTGSTVMDAATGVFGPGTHSLQVTMPCGVAAEADLVYGVPRLYPPVPYDIRTTSFRVACPTAPATSGGGGGGGGSGAPVPAADSTPEPASVPAPAAAQTPTPAARAAARVPVGAAVAASQSTRATSAAGRFVLPRAGWARPVLHWPAGTFASPVRITGTTAVAAASGSMLRGYGRTSVSALVAVRAGTVALRATLQPLRLVFPATPRSLTPAQARAGSSWRAIPLLAGRALPAGKAIGYYRVGGTVHVLMRQLTRVAMMGGPTLDVAARVRTARAARTLAVTVQAGRSARATVLVRTLAGTRVAVRQLRLLPGRRHALAIALPRSLRSGAYLVTVRAVSPPVASAKTLAFRLR